MKPREAALLLAVAQVLGKHLQEAKTVLSSAAELATGDRLTASLPGEGGRKVATVTRANGRTTATVDDERGLLAWCKEHYPTEVHTVEQVRPAFVEKLKSASADVGEGVDPATGNPLPFIKVSTGDPYTTVKLEKDAVDLIRQAWTSGAIDLRPVLELPAGGGDDT